MPPEKTLSAGDSIVFALAYFPAGQDPSYVKCGDSVCVSLTVHECRFCVPIRLTTQQLLDLRHLRTVLFPASFFERVPPRVDRLARASGLSHWPLPYQCLIRVRSVAKYLYLHIILIVSVDHPWPRGREFRPSAFCQCHGPKLGQPTSWHPQDPIRLLHESA